MNGLSELTPQAVLDSVGDGVYVTDTSRHIVYWNDAAEHITGWPAKEIVGKCCSENVLCHVDQDGNRLCRDDHCPLHRAIVTGQASTAPMTLYARGKRGGRIPLEVSVAPVRDPCGTIIGGVETFRDLSGEFRDIERARTIQSLSLQQDLPDDARIHFSTLYVPHDMVGGDYYAIARLDADHYGFLLADMTGHGVPAALYTMHLRSLWESNRDAIRQPAAFAQAVNSQLCRLIGDDLPFAAAVCGVFDLELGIVRFVGAGSPSAFLIRANGQWVRLDASGRPLGMLPDTIYRDRRVAIGSGDCVLFCTDGATEIAQPDGTLLGDDGLERILRDLGYPDAHLELGAIQARLLACSNRLRLEDDLSLLEVRLT